MKFLLSILLCVSFLFTQAQIIRQNLGGSPKVRTFVQGTIEGDSGMILRTAPDTSSLNVGNFTKKVNSLLVRVGDKLAFRDTLTKQWVFPKSPTDTILIIKTLKDSTKYVKSIYPVIITALNDSTYQWKLWQSFIDSALAGNSGITSNITWSVLDSISTPPTTPQIGNTYLVGTSPTGVFTGQPKKIAIYNSALAYTFKTPAMGDLLYNATNSFVSQWNGTNWIRITINNFVHITGTETIIGKKTFLDTLLLSTALDATGSIKFRTITNMPSPANKMLVIDTVTKGVGYVDVTGKRFGIEDNTGVENRVFDLNNTYNFKFNQANNFQITSGDLSYTNPLSTIEIGKNFIDFQSSDSNATFYSDMGVTPISAGILHQHQAEGGSIYIEDNGPILRRKHKIGLLNSHSKLTIPNLGIVNLIEVSRVIPVSVQANGTEYFAGDDGKINIGTISGGSNVGDSLVKLYAIKVDTGANYLKTVTLTNTGVIHNAPTYTYNSATHNYDITQTLATQAAYKAFTRGAGSGLPSFNNLDSNYWAGAWATQVRAATLNYQDTVTSWKTTGNYNVNAATKFGSLNNASLRTYTNNLLTTQLDSFNIYGSRFTVFGDASGHAYLDTKNSGNQGQLGLMYQGGVTTIDASGLLKLRPNTFWEIRTTQSSGDILNVKNSNGALSPSYFNVSFDGAVGIGNPTPAASAALEVKATNKGILIPRMTTAFMVAIPSPAIGLMIFNTDSASHCQYTGTVWQNMRGGSGGSSGVTSFGKVDGYGITSSVSNPTTTPVHTIAWDSTTAAKLRDGVLNNLIAQTLATQTAGSIFGNATTATAAPTFSTTPVIATSLGIGSTAQPLGRLDVTGSSASTDLVTFDAQRSVSVINSNQTAGNAQGIVLRSQSTNGTIQSGVKLLGVNTARTATGLTTDLAILTNANGTITEKMRVTSGGNVGIGIAAPDASAILDVTSVAKGVLLPRMTTANMNAIAAPATGLRIYNTTDSSNYTFDGVRWSKEIRSYGAQTITASNYSGTGASQQAIALYINNSSKSTGTTVSTGNIGIFSVIDDGVTGTSGMNTAFGTYAVNRGTGTAIGTYGIAYAGFGSGNRFGIIGRATQAISGNYVGGYFDLTNPFDLTAPSLTEKSAIIANNGGVANTSVFVGKVNGTTKFIIDNVGNVGVGQSTSTALLHIAAGTATANTAPIKLTAGTNLTTPEAGAMEFDGTNYFVTTGTTRILLTRTLTGTAAPATTPTAVGIQFVDTTNKKLYVATGTASSADWTILN